MKRMIDYKEFLELQDLANRNDQRLDYIEGAYTYFNLGLDDANFDNLLPSAPEDLSPQTLHIGDTVYIEGVATTLDADMIKEIFDSNLVIIDCGSAPTNYPTVFLQRQYVDEGSEYVSPRNARFKAFVTYGVALYEFTMTVAEYEATAQAGGYIVISCKEAHTKPVYFHGIEAYSSSVEYQSVFEILVLNNSPVAFDKQSFLQWVFNNTATLRIPVTGKFYVSQNLKVPYLIYKAEGATTDVRVYYTDASGVASYETVNLSTFLYGVNDATNAIN